MAQMQLDLNALAREKMYCATVFEKTSIIEALNQDFIKVTTELQETKTALQKAQNELSMYVKAKEPPK